MKTKALAPWFGSNRTLAHHVGDQLAGCEWVGVAFAGGMSEVAHIAARTVVVNDLHRGIINLARVTADPVLGPKLIRALRRVAFHPDELHAAQERCRTFLGGEYQPGSRTSFEYALSYFVSAWMARNGTAGTRRELDAPLSVRFDAGGGDSVVRFRSAGASLREWRTVLARCTFTVLDVDEFIDRVKDKPRHGLYLDPPFPGPGDNYAHRFTEEQQRQLAARLAAYKVCRVVCRFYRHPLIEELYPAPRWRWLDLDGGRKQSNAKDAPEVLIVNEPAAALTMPEAIAATAPSPANYSNRFADL